MRGAGWWWELWVGVVMRKNYTYSFSIGVCLLLKYPQRCTSCLVAGSHDSEEQD